MTQQDQLLTIPEVCAWLGVRKSKLHAMIALGEIPSVKLGRHRRFKRRSIAEWVDRREEGRE